jgi:hypothetical protein
MVDEVASIGVSTHPLTPLQSMDPDEQAQLKEAVKESIRQQVAQIVATRPGSIQADAVQCPNCGERVVFLDEPATFVFDKDSHEQICAACGADRDFVKLFRHEADIGGEGGGGG